MDSSRPRIQFAFLGIWLALALTVACQKSSPSITSPASVETASGTAGERNEATPTMPGSPLPTAVLAFADVSRPTAQEAAAGLPSPVPDPLRFVFPTPGPAPVSAWRPPLYPVPWAPTPYDHFYFTRPIAADQVNWPAQNYRYGGEFFENVIHTGVDIPAPKDTPVLAAGAGKVIWAGYGVYRGGTDITDPYGLAVTIRHDFGYLGQALYTVYGHLDQIDVVEGQHVEQGEVIGLVGETGRVTGPHLHFEVRIGENSFFSTRNPELWLAPPQGWGVLAGRIMDSNHTILGALPIILTSVTTNQNWFARSYGSSGPTISDPYYQENIVVGDLPAGIYRIRIAYTGLSFEQTVEIKPGLVSYFYFYGRGGIVVAPPPAPSTEYVPPLGANTP